MSNEAQGYLDRLEAALACEGDATPSRGRPKGKVAAKPFIASEYNPEGALHNRYELPPSFAGVYKTEKYEHRVIAFLKSQGLTTKEIAEQVGYHPVSVGQILRIPWVAELIAQEIVKAGRAGVEKVLRGDLMTNIEFLREVRDNDKNRVTDRLAACKELMDRTLGKSTQVVAHTELPAEALSDAQLAEIIMSATGKDN